MRYGRAFIILLLAVGLTISAHAADKVTCYTTWDQSFLYAGFEVQDPDVETTNTTHMSNPWEDDAIEVYVETDLARATNRTPKTFEMSVSAGGGSSWLIGQNGIATPKKIFSYKFAKRVQGTPNDPYDKDIGYTIEVAIPWSEMGGPPSPNQVMGFNVICRLRGENTGFVSFSPEVKTEDDIQNPSKWSKIKFVDAPTIISMQDGATVCRKVKTAAPIINGNLGPGEWIRDMRFQLARPEPTSRPVRKSFPVERLALTHYFYWYQADPRKEAPVSHSRYENGASTLTDHPLDGVGPWFSCDNVQWHKDQLEQVGAAGIDVIIPVYWGDPANRRGFADTGLDCMVQAMKELKAEGKSFPLVGMFFDTSSMQSAFGDRPDLKTDEGKATFYGMMKDFFLHVPDEFRATIGVPFEKGGYPAYIAVLYTSAFFADYDQSLVEYCNQRFAEDFGGKRILWIASTDYKPKAAVMDGYCDYGGGLGLKRDSSPGWIDVAGIGAGYDDSAVADRANHLIRSRMNGDTYKKDWDAVMADPPSWVIVDGWNELHEGSDICPSVQYGDRYQFLTKLNLLRFNGMRPHDAKFLKHDTPSSMLPGALYQVTMTVKNAGTKPWYPGTDGLFLSGRWYKDGIVYADTNVRLPLQGIVLAGQSFCKSLGVRTVDQDGKPLPDGDYELRFEMVRARDEWFSNGGDTPLCVPVKVASSIPPGFTLVESSLPTLAKAGGTYTAVVKLRNDGPATWKSGSAKIGYRIAKASVHLPGASEEASPVVGANESAVTLGADVEPGRVMTFNLAVSFVGQDGTPLPAWTQNDLFTYLVRWDVFDGEKWLAPPGAGCFAEAVKLTPTDFGPKFISGDTPDEMEAGKSYKVNLVLANNGTDPWTKAGAKVGYHWYNLDGSEAVWDGAKSSLPGDIRPSEQAAVKASVTAPAMDGQYYLVWDLLCGDKWASTTANTRGDSTQILRVNVSNGKLIALDLAKLFDADVASLDTNRADGDADGAGLTLPAEFLPPLVGAPLKSVALWPCGLWNSVEPDGAMKRISFRYAAKTDGSKNAIACKGQTIDLKSGKYEAVHLVVLAAQKTPAAFDLVYGDVKSAWSGEFAPWTESPSGGMHPAFVCLHRHSPQGDQPNEKCYLTHCAIPANPKAGLTQLVLPNAPALKVLAITLEKAD